MKRHLPLGRPIHLLREDATHCRTPPCATFQYHLSKSCPDPTVGHPQRRSSSTHRRQRLRLLATSFRLQPRLFPRNPLEQFARRFVVRVLRHQLAHDGELEDGLLEGVEAGFGGEQGVEVFGEALPVGGEFGGVGALGERAEQGCRRAWRAPPRRPSAPLPAGRRGPSVHRLWRRCGVVRRGVEWQRALSPSFGRGRSLFVAVPFPCLS